QGTNHFVSGEQGHPGYNDLANILFSDRLPEAWPTRVRIVLGFGAEQRVFAANAAKQAAIVKFEISTGEGGIGLGVARDVKLLVRQHLPPLGFGPRDLREIRLPYPLA